MEKYTMKTAQGNEVSVIDMDDEWQEFYGWDDLTEEAKKDHDYLETVDEQYGAQFIKHRDTFICLDQFMRCEQFPGFHGFASDSYFSGTAIMLSDDGQCYKAAVICGQGESCLKLDVQSAKNGIMNILKK